MLLFCFRPLSSLLVLTCCCWHLRYLDVCLLEKKSYIWRVQLATCNCTRSFDLVANSINTGNLRGFVTQKGWVVSTPILFSLINKAMLMKLEMDTDHHKIILIST